MLSNDLISQLSNKAAKPANIIGAMEQGQKLAGNTQAMAVTRQKLMDYQSDRAKQEEIQRILSVASPGDREQALWQAGMPKEALAQGNLSLNRSKFDADQTAATRTLETEQKAQAARNAFYATLTPEQQAMAEAFPSEFGKGAIKNAFDAADPAKAPTWRTVNQGDRSVTQEWDAKSNAWVEVGDAPRWAPAKPGTTIYDPNTGNPIATIGGGSSAPFGKTTGNKIEESVLNAANLSARLDNIAASYDPRYLQTGTRLWNIKENLLNKFNAGTADPEEVAFIDEMTAFYTDAFNNLNVTLKELSGAAVNEHEMKRLTQELPTPGELNAASLLAGDGPRRFEAKLKAGIRRQKLAIARFSYYKNRGEIADFDKMKANGTLESLFGPEGKTGVDQLMQSRGEELEKLYESQMPDASQDEVYTYVKERIRSEFGL